MDFILEAFDTFVGDQIYAKLLPAFAPANVGSILVNGTYSTMLKQPMPYTFEPASQLFSFEPTDLAYMSQWPRNNIIRQAISLYFITLFFGIVTYALAATASYVWIFDKDTFKHPKYIKGQIALEISETLHSMPWIALFTTPFFLTEVRGYSKMYDTTAEGPGRWYDIMQFPLFIAFTDCLIYWIHRGLHHPKIYKHLHKRHHKWVVPTPFASHAFHPIDGFSQSLPYHIFPFLFPLQKFAYIALFVFINIWTVMIHDGEYATNSSIINGAACHTMHHLYFNYNYGQFTTVWDRIGGSYRKPNDELFNREAKMGAKEWERQAKEAEDKIKSVEGEDDRSYLVEETKKSR